MPAWYHTVMPGVCVMEVYHGSIMTVQWAPGGLGLPQNQTILAAQLAQLVNHLVAGGGTWLSWDG